MKRKARLGPRQCQVLVHLLEAGGTIESIASLISLDLPEKAAYGAATSLARRHLVRTEAWRGPYTPRRLVLTDKGREVARKVLERRGS